MVAKRQTYRTTEQNGEPRNRSFHIQFNEFWQGCQDDSMGKEESGAGNTGYSHAKEWSWMLTLHHMEKLTQNRSKTKTIKLL